MPVTENSVQWNIISRETFTRTPEYHVRQLDFIDANETEETATTRPTTLSYENYRWSFYTMARWWIIKVVTTKGETRWRRDRRRTWLHSGNLQPRRNAHQEIDAEPLPFVPTMPRVACGQPALRAGSLHTNTLGQIIITARSVTLVHLFFMLQ